MLEIKIKKIQEYLNGFHNLLEAHLNLVKDSHPRLMVNAMVNQNSNLILFRITLGSETKKTIDVDGIEWNYCYNLLSKRSLISNLPLQSGRFVDYGDVTFFVKDWDLSISDIKEDVNNLLFVVRKEK